MNIAIIGTGNMAQGLGALLAAKHNVTFGSREPKIARNVAAKLNAAHGGAISDAMEAGEAVILAVPYPAALELASLPANEKALSGKVVIDISNPLSEDLKSLVVGHTTSAAEEIARRLSGARVVKAFNTIFADVLRAKAANQAPDVTVFVAGDDRQAKSQVLDLVSGIGFASIDAGPLMCARYLEPLTMLELQLGYAQGLGTRMGLRLVGAAAAQARA